MAYIYPSPLSHLKQNKTIATAATTVGSDHRAATASPPPPHVIVVPYPSQGHINPLLQFAKRLAFAGVRVTFATTSAAVVPGVEIAPISDGFDSASAPAVGDEANFLTSFKANGSATLSRLVAGAAVSCVVYDAFLPWALDVAKAHGIPAAAFFTNSATVSAFFALVHGRRLATPLAAEAARAVLPGVAWEARDLPSFLRRPETYPAYLEMKLSQFGNLKSADWVFCNSFDDLEIELVKEVLRDEWPATLIGPMVPSFYLDGTIQTDRAYGASLWKPMSQECSKWLDSQPLKSVVYISFGSMAALTQTQALEIGAALQKGGFPFLWVVRESQLGTLPEGFADATREKGLIVTWCDQLEVLAHPSVGCFVTHCGWNSTLEALSLGVPMVAVPQWTDQLTDAKFIADVWRVGVRVTQDEQGVVMGSELAARLAEVMAEDDNGEETRRNAAKWMELAKKALSKGGSSAKNIEGFVEDLKLVVNGKGQNGKV